MKKIILKYKKKYIDIKLISLILLFIISGCTSVAPKPSYYYQKDWTEVENMPINSKLYCYSTLANIVCYNKPIFGQDHRLVESNGSLIENDCEVS